MPETKGCPRCNEKNIYEFGDFKSRPGYINLYWKCPTCGLKFDGVWVESGEPITDFETPFESEKSK